VVKAIKDGVELKELEPPEEKREGLTQVEGRPAIKVRDKREGWELKILVEQT